MTADWLQRLHSRHPWYAAVGLFAVCALLASGWLSRVQQERLTIQRNTMQSLAREHALAVESRMQRLLSATYLLAAVVRAEKGQLNDALRAGHEIAPYFPGVTSLSLAPQGVLTHAIPLAGNENSLGLRLLEDPRFREGSLEAVTSKKLTLDGPFQLVQGGHGVVARLPVFLPDTHGQERFWGLVNVTIRFPDALEGSGLGSLADLGYDYRLWRQRSTPSEEDLIAASTPHDDHVHNLSAQQHLRFANTEWVLELWDSQPWWKVVPLSQTVAAAALCLLAAFVLKTLLDMLYNARALQSEVRRRTQDSEATRQQLQATLHAIPDLMLELDLQGHVLQIHASGPLQHHDTPPPWRVGAHIRNELPPEACDVFMQALQHAHQQGRSSGWEFALQSPSVQWYEISAAPLPVPAGHTTRLLVLLRDITVRKQAQAQLQLSEQFFQSNNEGFVITNAQQRILQVNPAFTKITGYSAEEVLGRTPRVLSSGRQSPGFYRHMWAAIDLHGHWQGEVWNRRKNGEIYPEWLSIDRVCNSHGETTHYIAIFSDISVHRAQEDRIRDLAHFDSLTGLANLTLLKDHASHDLSQAKRLQQSISLLLIDLDHFKQINESLGHPVGDQILKQVSQRLQAMRREHDTVARIGSDEFIVWLPNTGSDGATHVAQNLLDWLARPYDVDEQELTVTPSIGIALYPSDGQDFESLFRCAETAMHRAKEEGRNNFSFFTQSMQAQSVRRLQLENALRRALERQQLSLHYQPQMSLTDGRIMGAEVLLRWQHPDWGFVSPAEFIPIAEHSGQIIAIGEWVLRTACAQWKHWKDQGLLHDCVVAVNVSAAQFRQEQLPTLVSSILQETGLAPASLELELTESATMQDPQAAIAIMDDLHDRGILMSVDDFGTGYSSLSYLKRFQVYKLKIDQSFVRGVPHNAEDAGIVDTIVKMAHSLGMVTIAEGVETPEQQAFLRSHGCEEMQGYLLSRPLPAPAFEVWLRERRSGENPRPS